ncbi:MAG TPA: type VI secretion system-associated FHA domain protein TagH [Caulobacteraceae bacterium]|jgi:type VI secretion system FHA domain protein
MSLLLSVQNMDRLDNGEAAQLKLDRHGAIIGRSPHSDWSLPDQRNYVSSTHCEIDFRDGGYVLVDKSTNGTFLNDAPERMAGPHKIKDGDVIIIGQYRIVARLADGAQSAPAPTTGAAKGGWGGWDEPAAGPAAAPSSAWDAQPQASPAPSAPPPASSGGWSSPPEPASPSPASGWGDPAPAQSASGWGNSAPQPAPSWGASAPQPTPTPARDDAWGSVAAQQPAASGWDPLSTSGPAQAAADPWADAPASAISGRGAMAQSFAAPKAAWDAPSAEGVEDVWGKFSASNVVDWARSGFGDPEPAPAAPAAAPQAAPHSSTPAAPRADDALWAAFLQSSGVSADLVKASPAEAMAAAGGLLRRLVAGLVVMMEARARAKAQLGAQSTTLELAGNNPLKFARSADKVLAQLLGPAERGFMPAEKAVEDSFQDLQAHQMATLAAMQGALRATVDRFSPEAIRKRAETRGVLARIIPSARDAALWEAYQKEFEGVARGSDEAFLDVFAKAFKEAYEKSASDLKRGA